MKNKSHCACLEGAGITESPKRHTLQGKLTLLVGLLMMTSLCFFFGNYELADRMNQKYVALVDQNQLVSLYAKTLLDCRDTLTAYSKSIDGENAVRNYRENVQELVRIAAILSEDFSDPYIENLSYLSSSFIAQGNRVIAETEKLNIAGAREAYLDFSADYDLLNKYMFYVQQSAAGETNQKIDEITAQQIKSFRVLLLVFCFIAVLLFILSYVGIRRMVQPIKHLTEMACLVMQNVWDLPQWDSPSQDETGILLTSFYHMVQTIREQIERLKQQQRIEMQQKEEERKKLQLEYRNVQLELKALQNQVNPHFLFNCLNMIAKQAYIEEAPQTQHTTEAIARYLRSVLDQTNDVVTIEKEMQGVQNYLDIQTLRFGDRFQYDLSCDPQCKAFRVPFMILQPLVENTFTHGIDNCTREIRLSCKAEVRENGVFISVEDNGPGMEPEKLLQLRSMVKDRSQENTAAGIGLINVFRRLQLYFNGRVDICIESMPYVRTAIGFFIPDKLRDSRKSGA